jgi:hypothetical protein
MAVTQYSYTTKLLEEDNYEPPENRCSYCQLRLFITHGKKSHFHIDGIPNKCYCKKCNMCNKNYYYVRNGAGVVGGPCSCGKNPHYS